MENVMTKTKLPHLTILASLMAAWGGQTALAAPITFVQYPAGSAYKMPIPNVILSVDNSGSMDSTDGTTNSRIGWLKAGLQNTLINQTKYDSKFRLAWQSFTCNNIPSSSGFCANKNAIGDFSGTHKSDFATWVNGLAANGWTPSHELVWNAGQYLMTTGANSPWNATPGTADSAPLTCRKAYHVFLTDGGWNRYKEDILPSYNGFSYQTKMASTSASKIADEDQTTTTFPDGTTYSLTDPQTRVYRGAGGSSTPALTYTSNPPADATCSKTTAGGACIEWQKSFAFPTLSDMAFYFWSRDLQPGIADKVIPSIKKSGNEIFTVGNSSVTLDEYWNPKNDPATWQHLTQYTIGYGPTASTWSNSGSNPLMGDPPAMYGSGFAQAVLGTKLWTDVTTQFNEDNYDSYRPEDLWHMAINSRGKYFPVKGGDLSAVFDEIFGAIVADNSQPITSFTSASGSISRVGTSAYQSGYVVSNPNDAPNQNRWYGFVTSNTISTSGASTPNAAWGVNGSGKNISTGDKLDALTPTDISNRVVLSFNDSSRQGVSFEWGATASPLSDTQRTLLNRGNVTQAFGPTNGDNKGKDRLDFIRGDRTKEASQTGGTLRVRKSRQGDIVNSAIWYVGAPASGYSFGGYEKYAQTQRPRIPMLYVGGNDGMLHGFSAADGTEKIAYVPQGVIKNLPLLADVGYSHQYYVDGSPFTGDIKLGSGSTAADWSTYLVGTLGAGGRGYFVLDVSKPGTIDNSTGSNFTKLSAKDLVVMDKTAYNADATDPNWADNWKDIGYIFGKQVVAENNAERALSITRTNDGRWALILGNGYNSDNERPVLLIHYLDGDKKLKTIPAVSLPSADASDGNGLSTPQFLDVNGDGIPDFVYAGDLRGNLWKFDLSSKDASTWSVAFSGVPLFKASYTDATNNSTSLQPITTPPVLRPNPEVGGLMVGFGTGRNLTEGDRTDTSKQTMYSILDNTRYEVVQTGSNKGTVKVCTDTSGNPPKCPTPTTIPNRSGLQNESVITSSKTAGGGISSGRAFWALNSTKVTYSCSPDDASCTVKKGWYMDLPEDGERVLAQTEFYDGGNILEIITEVPASGSSTADNEEVCTPSPRAVKNFRTLLNITTGQPATAPLMNVNGDTYTDASGKIYGIYNVNDTYALGGGKSTPYSRMEASPKELRIANRYEQSRTGADGKKDNLAKLPELLLRPNWRQLK